MKTRAVLALAVCALTPLVAAPRPAAAAGVNAVVQAVGSADPFVFCWTDSAKGQVGTDDKTAKKIHDALAGATYLVTDQLQFVIGKAKGNELSAVVTPGAAAKNKENTYFLIHGRSQDGKTVVDGTFFSFSDDPSKGIAYVTMVMQDGKGNAITAHIEQTLIFGGAQPAPEEERDFPF